MGSYIYVRYIYDITMITNSTVRSFGGSIYVKIPPTFAEYYKLKKLIEYSKKKGTEPECKIEDSDVNKLLVTFQTW